MAEAELVPPPVAPQPAPARGPRVSTQGGRFRRWHLEARPDTEEEGWLLTYLDVITLILVMMVVMLAVAGPPGAANKPATNPAASQTSTTVQPAIVPPVPLPVVRNTPAETPQDTKDSLNLDHLGSDIEVLRSDDAVRFRISSELMFDSGAASLAGPGLAALERLVPILQAQPELRLVIEGHTDSEPIRSERYPSNWELSTGRAGAVARFLIERGVAPQRLQASGFANTRPIASPSNPVDRAVNRRVELIMETPLAAKTRK